MNAKMYVLKVSLVSAMVLAVVMWAQTSSIKKRGESSEMKETLTGIVSDSQCGSTHIMKGEGDRECTRLCVSIGCQYALAVGKDLYILEGRQDDLDKYAGEEVILTGSRTGHDTIFVESVFLVRTTHNAGSEKSRIRPRGNRTREIVRR
jgi:hypothetical protein